jgi:hypothetical protein
VYRRRQRHVIMSNGLITEEELKALHEKYHREHPEAVRARCQQCKLDRQHEDDRAVRFVCESVREDATYTIKDLSFAVGRRPAWVRSVLQDAGLTAPEAVRTPQLPKSKRPCATCGHVKCHHCRGKVPRMHVNPGILGAYPCPLRVHCKGVVEVALEQFTNCSCTTSTSRRP